jgi:5-methylcytosine-specific restriction endonuclease McrA
MATREQRNKIWTKAKKVRGKDPKMYRQDPYGRILYRESYGKDSEMGWCVDHIIPKARGGSDATVNLQALSCIVNKQKRDSLVKRNRHSAKNH